MAKVLTVRTFGPLLIEAEGQPVLLNRHCQALLAVLATRLNRRVERDTILDLLWDVSDLRKARHSLSQLLYTATKVLPAGCLSAYPKYLVLESAHVESDYHTFYEALTSGDLDRALSVYGGSFLDSLPYVTDRYDDWRGSCAAHAAIEATSACVSLVNAALEREDHHLAAEIAKRGMMINPASEYLARVRIESLASAGEIALALRDLELARRHFKLTTGTVPLSLSDELSRQISRLPVLQQHHATDPLSPRLVGRTAEIRALRLQWDQAKQACRVALIRGAPGIGKSRILHHTARRAVLENARCFAFTCSEAESKLAYSAIVGVLRDGYRPHDLERLTARWQQALGRLAPELLSVSNHDTDPPRIIWEAIAQYFGNVSTGTPVIIAIDDYHWIDDSSREVLTYIAKRLPDSPILILAATRGREDPPIYEDDRALAMSVDLTELGLPDLYEIISDFSGRLGIVMDEGARSMLLARAGGRPFFLVQILRHIRDSGLRECTAENLRDVLPPSIEAYVNRTLGSLGQVAKSVASAAAVLSRDASVHLVARVTGRSTMDAAIAIGDLVRTGMFTDAPYIRFSHELIREAALLCLSASQKALWHGRWAEVLANEELSRPHELAFHYEQAGVPASAFKYARDAAAEAIRVRDHAGAEEQYTRMIRCGDQRGRLFAQGELLKLRYRLGRFRGTEGMLTDLELFFAESDDYEGVIACALARYWIAEHEGSLSPRESIAQAKRIVAIAEQHSPGQIAAVMWQVADAIRRSGEYDILADFAAALEQRSRNTGFDLASASEMMTVAALLGGLAEGHVTGLRLACRAVDLAEQTRDPVLIGRAVYARGTARVWTGDLAGAQSDYDYVLGCGEHFLHDDLLSRLKSNYAVVLMEQGRYEDAEQYALAALREAGAARRVYAYGNLALIHLRSGNLSASRHYCKALLSSNESNPQPWIELHAAGLLGLADLADGNIQGARIYADQVKAHCEDDQGVVDRSHLYLLSARIAHLDHDYSTAESLLRSGISAIAHKEAIAGARLRCALAETVAASGQVADATVILNDVRDTARRGGFRAVEEEAERMANTIAGYP